MGVGPRLGRFEIIRLVGSGGMGTVYEANDPDLGRSVAVKVILGTGAGDSSARLLREAQALAQLSHPNVVAVHDAGVAGGELFVAMEFIDGETLQQRLERRPHTWREILGLYLDAARGLAAAHARSLVHRDFKPANVLVDREGHVRVTDFGLARLVADDEVEHALITAAPLAGDTSTVDEAASLPLADAPTPLPGIGLLAAPLTMRGAIIGTPRYMAPEQRARLTATALSDQYSYCVSLWEGLFGAHPTEDARGGRGVPRAVVRALERGMAANPRARHPSMHELIGALEAAAGKPRWRRPLIALALVAASAAGGVWWARRPSIACDAAGDAVAELWSPRARGRALAALAAARPDGAATDVVAQLDAWSERWRTGLVDACRAAHQRGEHSPALYARRSACMARGLFTLRPLVAALETADARAALRAPAALERLPAVEACSAASLAGTAPGDDTPAAAALRAEIAAAEVAVSLGDRDPAARALAVAVAEARRADHPELLARALMAQAELLAATDADSARRALEEASTAAARAGARDLEAGVAVRLLGVVVDQGSRERAAALLPLTRATVAAVAPQAPQLVRELAWIEARQALREGRPHEEIAAACRRLAALEVPGQPRRAAACWAAAAERAADE